MKAKRTTEHLDSGQDAEEVSDSRSNTSLATRWRSWTLNLLATGLVLVTAIAILRSALPWWQQEAAPTFERDSIEATIGPDPQLRRATGTLVTVGDVPYRLKQSEVKGTHHKALDALRESCRQAVLTGVRLQGALKPAEIRMLNSLHQLEPVERESGKWAIYQLDGPAPMVAVVSDAQVDADSQRPIDSPAAKRVLSWGIAIRNIGDRWSLYTYPAAQDEAAGSTRLKVTLPDDSRRVMSLSTGQGGELLSFLSQTSVSECKEHFDELAKTKEWTLLSPWQKIGPSWLSRFGRDGQAWIDVQIASGDNGATTGFVTMTTISTSN